MFSSEEHHEACLRVIEAEEVALFTHGLAEVFSTMTGGRAALRIDPRQAAELLAENVASAMHLTTLTPAETLRALTECSVRGVQGGAIYDYLHLAAARKAKVKRLFTLNVSHFRAFHRAGDPEIAVP